jgi:uncharacterized delta-60 repeat protein
MNRDLTDPTADRAARPTGALADLPSPSGVAGAARRMAPRFPALVLATLLAASVAPPDSRAAVGDLDPTLDADGRVTTDFAGTNDRAAAVAVQPDGRIVAAGSTLDGGALAFALARYMPDGALDPAFGAGGRVTTSFFGVFDQAAAVAIQPDGKIVVAGVAYRSVTNSEFALARYTPDGSLDPTFGTGGRATADFFASYDEAVALALQPDGRLVVAGYTYSGPHVLFALARFDASGALDGTFGSGGKTTADFPGAFGAQDLASALALQSDGKIVAGGIAADDFALARFNPDGSADLAFGVDGMVTTDFLGSYDAISGLRVQPDGKIVAAGVAVLYISQQDIVDYEFALARYNVDGSLDTDADADPATHFDGDGKTMTDFSTPPGGNVQNDRAFAVVLQPDGKIVAAGVGGRGATGPGADFALARYNADGSLDASFGSGGKVLTDFAGGADAAFAVALQTDGKIVAAGSAGGADFALARYEAGAGPPAGTLTVDVRVIPGSINPCANRAIIQAVIFSEPGFDALTVEVTTVRLNSAQAAFGREADVDLDGDVDAIFVFPFEDVGVTCGDTELFVTGATTGGDEIRGIGAIRTVGCAPTGGCE